MFQLLYDQQRLTSRFLNGEHKSRSSRRRSRSSFSNPTGCPSLYQVFWRRRALAFQAGIIHETKLGRAIPDRRLHSSRAILCHTLYSISNVNSSSGELIIQPSSSSAPRRTTSPSNRVVITGLKIHFSSRRTRRSW